jgi:hypothetical protein
LSAFEFIFPLFGLLVGLSYAEILGGMARALKSSREIRIGRLTPMLALLVLVNLTIFWFGAWQLRDIAQPTSGSLLMTLLLGGTYYLASAMVFPAAGDARGDLDEHFFATRRVSLLAITACNLLGLATVANAQGWAMRPVWWAGNGLFVALLLVAAFAAGRKIVLGALAAMIAVHGLGVALS